MKRTGFYLLVSFSICLGLFTSCLSGKKKEDPTPEAKKIAQSDQSGTSAADEALEDVSNYINNEVGGGSNKRLEAYNLPCGTVSVDSTTINGVKIYKINYGDKTKCGYKYKSGTVAFQLISGAKFNDVGAVFKITFINYVVEVLATNDIVTLNGNITSKNSTGGYVWESVTANKTVTHIIRGSFNVTYANGETRNKKYYQTRTWASINGWEGLNLTVKGDTLTDVSEIGRTVDGNYYYETHILTPFKWSNCGTSFAGPYKLKVGKARLNAVIPNLSPTYFEVEAGYSSTAAGISPFPVGDCNSNTYKITTQIGTTTITQYQLY